MNWAPAALPRKAMLSNGKSFFVFQESKFLVRPLIRQIIFIFTILIAPVSEVRADNTPVDKYDSLWSGVMKCGSCSGCSDQGFQRIVNFEIKSNKFIDITGFGLCRRTTCGDIEGEVATESGFFMDVGDVEISGQYYWNEYKNFSFTGPFRRKKMTLKGTRGPRHCTLAMQEIQQEIQVESVQVKALTQDKKLELCKNATTIFGDWLPTDSRLGAVLNYSKNAANAQGGGRARDNVAAAKSAGLTENDCKTIKAMAEGKTKSEKEMARVELIESSEHLELCQRATTMFGDWLPVEGPKDIEPDAILLQDRKYIAMAKAVGLTEDRCKSIKALASLEEGRKRKATSVAEKQKRKDAERKRLAEAKRQAEEARRIAELKRKEEEARLAAEAARKAEEERERQKIASVQESLKTLGFYKGGIDGAMGRGTTKALTSWLTQQGRQKTDELNDAIISELNAAAEAKRLAELERKRTEEEERRLAEAKRKAEAARLAALESERQRQRIVSAQQSLNTLGLYKGKVDGKLGRNSRAALGSWLEQNGYTKTTPLDDKIIAQLDKTAEAHVARLATEAEAKRLAELERKRKEEEARRLAEAKRKAEAEAKRLAELERKRKEEEARRLVEADRALFAQLEPRALADLKDVQIFIRENPTSKIVLDATIAAVGLKKGVKSGSGQELGTNLKAFKDKVGSSADFIAFRKQLVVKREQAAQELAAKKAREAKELAERKEREAALAFARKKQELGAYQKFLVKALSDNLSTDSALAQALLPIIQNVEVGVQSKDRVEVASVLASVKQQIDANTKIKRAFAAGEAAFKAELKRLAAQEPQKSPEKTQSVQVAAKTNSGKGRYADVAFGNYHALVIGNNDYKHMVDLKTAQNDARSIANVLERDFGFKVRTIVDASRSDILDAFDDYSAELRKTDNFLLYYAGHGWLDEGQEEGFWLPVDAKTDRRSAWIPNATIMRTLKGFQAKHVMVVADSCYSGTLTRGIKIEKRTVDYVRDVVGKKARIVMSSGGLEPVEDGGTGNNSPFASALLKALTRSGEVLTATSLFKQIQRPVQLNSDQTPVFADIRKAGHDGGDFLFVKRN